MFTINFFNVAGDRTNFAQFFASSPESLYNMIHYAMQTLLNASPIGDWESNLFTLERCAFCSLDGQKYYVDHEWGTDVITVSER
jgi:hypothetical protein